MNGDVPGGDSASTPSAMGFNEKVDMTSTNGSRSGSSRASWAVVIQCRLIGVVTINMMVTLFKCHMHW